MHANNTNGAKSITIYMYASTRKHSNTYTHIINIRKHTGGEGWLLGIDGQWRRPRESQELLCRQRPDGVLVNSSNHLNSRLLKCTSLFGAFCSLVFVLWGYIPVVSCLFYRSDLRRLAVISRFLWCCQDLFGFRVLVEFLVDSKCACTCARKEAKALVYTSWQYSFCKPKLFGN